jgi:uncharacterized protein
MLGDMYAKGKGARQEYAVAMSWFRKAADQGNALAQFELGRMHFKGQGVLQDFAAAASWFRKAADQGNAPSQLALGIACLDGVGVRQDYVSAHMWLNLSAAAGIVDAAKYREEATAKMTPAQIAEAQKLAREWKPKRRDGLGITPGVN